MVIRVGMVGTFDVANFGDLLFPLLAREELARRLGAVEIVPYSYNARPAAAWPFEVRPLERLSAEVGSLHLLLVGGGDIIRFDHLVALDYRPASPAIHHPTGFWLAPIFLAHTARVPVAWNAPGVPGEVPSWAHILVRAGLAVTSRISVRDEASRARLTRVAPGAKVEVVPDSGFNAAMLLPDPPPRSDYFVVQSRPQSLQWIARMRRLLRDDHLQFVIAPVGPATNDPVRPPSHLPPRTSFRHPSDPREMLALISGSRGVVGPSLHLTIAALSLGRPVFRPGSTALSKYRMLEGLDGVHEFDLDGEASLEPSAPDPGSPRMAEIQQRLARHWDSIASLADGSALRGPQQSWEPMMMDIWQNLPARLERRSALSRLGTQLQIIKTKFMRARYGGRRD